MAKRSSTQNILNYFSPPAKKTACEEASSDSEIAYESDQSDHEEQDSELVRTLKSLKVLLWLYWGV